MKSSVICIGENDVVATAPVAHLFNHHFVIEVTNEEGYPANCVHVNGSVLFPEDFLKKKQKLIAAAIEVIELDRSEFRKMDGGMTCLSLLM